MGRFVCGWLCPFGLIQDLLHKIPFVKKIGTFRGDRLLRKLKYVIFLVFVILLPMFVVDMLGQGAPYFCKLICPAGTLEGGIQQRHAYRGGMALCMEKCASRGDRASVCRHLPAFLQIYLSPGRGVFGV